MRAASPPRQMERENEMIVISHRLFLWTMRAGRDSHALHRHFERSEKSFSLAKDRQWWPSWLAAPVRRPIKKTYKKQLTQERQCGKIIPVADEAAPFERAMKRFQKNHLTNLYECGKIIKSLEERWFFEN